MLNCYSARRQKFSIIRDLCLAGTNAIALVGENVSTEEFLGFDLRVGGLGVLGQVVAPSVGVYRSNRSRVSPLQVDLFLQALLGKWISHLVMLEWGSYLDRPQGHLLR